FGFMLAIALMIAVSWIFARSTPRRVDRWFRRLQFISAALYSLGHGGNDAQKTMGIIWMLLIASGLSAASEPLPFWVVLACLSAVRWGVAGNIIWAWIFTIPGSAFIAGVAWLLGTEYF